MPQVDPVILRLEADLAKYRSDMAGAQRLTDQKLDAIEARGAQMGQNLRKGFDLAKAAAVGFIAKLGYDELKQAAAAGLEYASSLGETAQQLGVTTNALQEYRYAASQAGLSQEDMDQALSQLTRRIGEAANGTKAQKEAFEKLGISVKGAKGEILDVGSAIPKIADALEKVKSPAERAAVLMDLFGRAGQKLEPLLAGGSKAVNELREAAHKLGLVLSEDQIQHADDTADKLSALNQVLSAQIAGIVSDNAQSIYALANALSKLTANAIQFIDQNPRLSAALAGAAIGARLGGGYGAAAGAAAGIFVGDQVDQQKSDSNMDLRFRTQQLRNATAQYRRLATQAKTGGGSIFSIRSSDEKGVTLQGAKAELQRQQALMAQALLPGPTPSVATQALATSPAGNKTGASAADLAKQAAQDEARYQDELGRLRIDRLRAEADYTGSIEDKYAAVLSALDDELASFKRQVETDDSLDNAKRETLIKEKTAAVDAERRNALADKAADLAEQKYRLETAANRIAQDDADAALRIADTREEQYKIEKRILDLKQSQERAELERLTQSRDANEVAAGKAGLANLDQRQAADQTALRDRYASPLEQYSRRLQTDGENINDRVESLVVDELQSVRDSIHDGITKTLGIKDPLLAGIVQMFIDQVIMKPIAEALAKASGDGGGGIIGGIVSIGTSLFGRASGGYVAPGQMVRVNEAASPGRVEGFRPLSGGHVIPLGRMNAAIGGSSSPRVFHINVDARNSVTPDGFADALSNNILRRAAQMDAQASQATLRAVPGRADQYQRDGF